jgi:hypothetical protein
VFPGFLCLGVVSKVRTDTRTRARILERSASIAAPIIRKGNPGPGMKQRIIPMTMRIKAMTGFNNHLSHDCLEPSRLARSALS